MLFKWIILIFHFRLIDCQSFGDVRLHNGPFVRKGRLEIFYSYQWGTVCDDDFDNSDAVVACRQLGYSTGFMVNSILIPDGTGKIWLENIQCYGFEYRLESCMHSRWGVNDCSHSEDVGVECFTSLSTGTLRIIEETLPMQGRLEVYINGIWGTICDNPFTDKDALVACRQMGYVNGISLGRTVTDGSGMILLDDVNCAGTESTITSCGHSGSNLHNCKHSEDVGVRCFVDLGICGGYFSSSSGTLTSPNYPSSYPRNVDCFYFIIVPAGYARITINDFFTEKDFDFLQIYYVWNISGLSLLYLSGKISPITIESTTNISLHFHSDEVHEYSGFLATYTSKAQEQQVEKTEDRNCCSPGAVAGIVISCIVLTVVCGLALRFIRKRLISSDGEMEMGNGNNNVDARAAQAPVFDNAVYTVEGSGDDSKHQRQLSSS